MKIYKKILIVKPIGVFFVKIPGSLFHSFLLPCIQLRKVGMSHQVQAAENVKIHNHVESVLKLILIFVTFTIK